MSGRFAALFALACFGVACAAKRDFTPPIAISPGFEDRIRVMDEFRHHGDVHRILPRVTVEEIDDDDDDASVVTEPARDASSDPVD